jgi:hypothetical protein
MRDKGLTVLNIMAEDFQDVSPCSPVDDYQHLEENTAAIFRVGVLFFLASLVNFAVYVLSAIIDFFCRNMGPLIAHCFYL